MSDNFKLPVGNTFPSSSNNPDRPRRRSIDTPALKLDTTSITSGKTININAFPPPPRGNAQAQTKVNIKQSPTKNALAISEVVALPQNDHDGENTPAMRSVFPQLISIPAVSQQVQTPSLMGVLPAASSRTTPYSPSLYSQPRSPPPAAIAADSSTATKIPPRKYQRPAPITEVDASNLSTPEQLLDLWTIALGQESPEALPKYTLGLRCNSLERNHESISLVSSSADFYAIKASGFPMTITRKHPLNSQTGVTIAAPNFETPTTTSPIVAVLVPTMAENQAAASVRQIAADNQLSARETTELYATTLKNIRSTEAGGLLWDSDSSSYFFTLPTIKEQQQAATPKPLPIEYVPGKVIRFMDGFSQPLLTLNLTDYSLVIETVTINSLKASSHNLDILLSGLLMLAVHLHRTDGVFSEPKMAAPYFAPPPRSTHGGKIVSSPRPSTTKTNRTLVWSPSTSPWLSRLNPLATRKQASQSSNSPKLVKYSTSIVSFDKDLERGSDVESVIMSQHRIPPMTTAPIAQSGIAPELRGSNTGVDLSKFQAFDLEDPDLGSGTKAALRILYWAFSVAVWILGVIIGVLAAGIVAVGGCLGGGKGSREG